jgi:hypothetical protein
MFSSFNGSFKFGRRRVITPAPVSDLILDLDASAYGGAGDWQDATANNLDAVAVQTPTYSANNGGYFDLNGGAISGSVGAVDSFEIADNSALESGFSAVSFEIYFWIDTVQTPGANLLFDKRSATTNGFVGFFNETGFTFRVGTASPNQITYTTTPVTNAWQHMVVTVASSGSKIYLDGAEVASSAYAGNFSSIDSTNSLRIGDVGFGNTGIFGLDGRIKLFRIYNKALTSAEVLTKYQDANAGTNLVLRLDPDNATSYSGSGTTWTDLAAPAQNLTLYGSPTYTSGTPSYFTFNGTTQRATGTDTGVISTTAYTKSAWFYLNGYQDNNIFSGDGHFIYMGPSASVDKKIYCGHSDWGSFTAYPSTATINLNTWYNVTLTFSTANGMTLYINGVQDSTYTAQKTAHPGTGTVSVGAYITGNLLNGRVGKVLAYNTELTAAQVLQNYNNDKATYGL